MPNLKLAPHLSVPSNIAARTIFVAGTKGSGKTHNAGVIANDCGFTHATPQFVKGKVKGVVIEIEVMRAEKTA